MLVESGFFGELRAPRVHIKVDGVLTRRPGTDRSMEATLDTGFSGFLSMPIVTAFPLGLPLYRWAEITLADGSKHRKHAALARVTIGDRREWVETVLEPNSDEILVGMKLLRALRLSLLVTRKEVLLLDDDTLVDFRDAEDLAVMGNAVGILRGILTPPQN